MSLHITLANTVRSIANGTGTFGNVVLRRFPTTDVGEIRIFGRDEKNQHDMRLR